MPETELKFRQAMSVGLVLRCRPSGTLIYQAHLIPQLLPVRTILLIRIRLKTLCRMQTQEVSFIPWSFLRRQRLLTWIPNILSSSVIVMNILLKMAM
jgi:hypothetical protein